MRPIPLNRIEPNAPVAAYKTYQLSAPVQTHFRQATCEEFNCPQYLNGWRTVLPAGDARCLYVRTQSGRAFTERALSDGMVEFTFPAGQTCFAQSGHRVSLEREPIYVVRDGDHRGNPTGRRLLHANGQDWVDDFGEHQNRIADQIERG